MLKKQLKRYAAPLRRTWRKLTETETGQYPVAHQGIQRSGTNYFCEVLAKADYRVLNRIDPPRDDPRHKHFRWQAEKSTIVMDANFRNTLTVGSVGEINRLCGYPSDTKHLVLFRAPRGWLDSIFRWGLQNRWFDSEEEFMSRQLYRSYLAEWDGFYATWADFARDNPEQVMIIDYGDLKRSPADMIKRIDTFMGLGRSGYTYPGEIERVRHSAPISERRAGLDHPELDAAVAEPGAFDWRSFSHMPAEPAASPRAPGAASAFNAKET